MVTYSCMSNEIVFEDGHNQHFDPVSMSAMERIMACGVKPWDVTHSL